MADIQEIKDTVLQYVVQEYLEDIQECITCDTPLISGGFVDSFSMVSLKRFLEHHYQISIPNELASAEAFDSVTRIAALVHELLRQP